MRKEVVYLIENNFAGNDKYSDWSSKISHIKGKDNVIADALSRSM
jgi:hypothetical protein